MPDPQAQPQAHSKGFFDSIRIPKIQGRRALLVINCQQDAFNQPGGGANFNNPPDFLDRIRRIIPYYRKTETEIVWVQTTQSEQNQTNAGGGSPTQYWNLSAYMPSSQQEEERPTLNDADKAKKQSAQDGHWRQESEGHKDLKLPHWRKTARGAELVEELADMFEAEKDLVIKKCYYSAFDETPLLMGLRMKMVTDVHICGGLSNVSIIYTAVEAAQHGLNVSVVEDCMGYRDEKLHLEAMSKMADEIGVHGVDSEEIILEAGGNPPPDADPNMFSGPGFSGINISPSRPKKSPTNNTLKTPQSSQIPEETDAEPSPSTPTRPKIGEGDCKVISNALPNTLSTTAFSTLKTEVHWLAMKHRTGDVPRRVAVQGAVLSDGSVPVYRHPADECPPLTPFSPTVLAIRDHVSNLLNQPFNHVLIQLYRTGADNISEHSDKTLDIARGSDIINVSLGAQRKMTLRVKKSSQSREQQARGERREAQKVTLPHNSVFVLGPATNRRWLHGVRPDKRPDCEKSEEELAESGERISLTFRNIGTWTDKGRKWIWGQGARMKTRREMENDMKVGTEGNVKPADGEEAERMLTAFGRENHQVEFDWQAEYGEGFDALDLVVINPPAG